MGMQRSTISKSACCAIAFCITLGINQAAFANEPATGSLIWQGFDHEWRRFVALPEAGRVPHRISRLSSYVNTDAVSETAIKGAFHFAQSTGVDGNYMWPTGYYSAFQDDAIAVYQDQLALTWTDTITNPDSIPQGGVEQSTMVHLTIPEGHQVAAVLNGIDLDISCDDAKQPANLPCNSNGLWPYDFYVGFAACAINDGMAHCPLSLRLQRGWTPMRGGIEIPPFLDETKPLNHRLDFRFTVHYSLITGPSSHFNSTAIATLSDTQELQNTRPISGEALLPWQDQLPQSELVTAITGFGFQLHEPVYVQSMWTLLGADLRQQGRYIARLKFHADNPIRHDQQELISLPYSTHVWAPLTVVDSMVTTHLDTIILELANPHYVSAQSRARNKLCINSTEQAPAFSRWKMCDLTQWWARWIYGPEQASAQTPINEVLR